MAESLSLFSLGGQGGGHPLYRAEKRKEGREEILNAVWAVEAAGDADDFGVFGGLENR